MEAISHGMENYLKRKALPCSVKGTVRALRNLLRMMHRSVTKVSGGGQQINIRNMIKISIYSLFSEEKIQEEQ